MALEKCPFLTKSGGRKNRPLSGASAVGKGLPKTLNVTGKSQPRVPKPRIVPTGLSSPRRPSGLVLVRGQLGSRTPLIWPRPALAGGRGSGAIARVPASAGKGNQQGTETRGDPPSPQPPPPWPLLSSQPLSWGEDPRGALFLPGKWQPRAGWRALPAGGCAAAGPRGSASSCGFKLCLPSAWDGEGAAVVPRARVSPPSWLLRGEEGGTASQPARAQLNPPLASPWHSLLHFPVCGYSTQRVPLSHQVLQVP